MNRQFLDKIKDSIQNAYDRFRVYQIKRSTKIEHNNFTKHFGEIKRVDPVKYIKYWTNLSTAVNPIGYQIHYTLHGVEDIHFVPKDVYYAIIEPCLNDYTMSKAYKDKNSYERMFKTDAFPAAYLRNMGGVYYDRDYKRVSEQQVRDILKQLPQEDQKVIIKPSIITGMRHNVRIFDFNKDQLTLEYLQENYGHNFLIQKLIIQNDYFNNLGTSVNIRINTYRSVSDNSIFIHDVRCGFHSGAGVDQSSYSNDQVAINNKGHLGSFSLSNKGDVLKTVRGKNIQFTDMVPIPNYYDLRKLAEEIALQCPYHRRLGIDMIVDKNGSPRIFEVNFDLLGFSRSQFLIGGLFQEYTDEVIEYCNRNKSKIYFPFTQ